MQIKYKFEKMKITIDNTRDLASEIVETVELEKVGIQTHPYQLQDKIQDLINKKLGLDLEDVAEIRVKKPKNKKKEWRVYVVNPHLSRSEESFRDCDDEYFIEIAEEQGTVYSLSSYQKMFNDDDINSETHFIRILKVDSYI